MSETMPIQTLDRTADAGAKVEVLRAVDPAEARREKAMIVSVLLFVAICLWGFVSGLIALSEGEKGETSPQG